MLSKIGLSSNKDLVCKINETAKEYIKKLNPNWPEIPDPR